MARETTYRSLLKAISYRLLSTIITGGIVFGVTGESGLAVAVAGFDSLVKIVSYYLHERAWTFIRFGFNEYPLRKFEVHQTRGDSGADDARVPLSELELVDEAL
jgi:uncharacterized membrane protein